MLKSDWPELAGAAQQRWNQNTAFWDDYMGDHSNTFHNLLVRPAMERLLAVQPGDSVLDIGCGNGNFSRHLAGLGTRVTAIDGSAEMIDRARKRTEGRAEEGPENENAVSIDYRARRDGFEAVGSTGLGNLRRGRVEHGHHSANRHERPAVRYRQSFVLSTKPPHAPNEPESV